MSGTKTYTCKSNPASGRKSKGKNIGLPAELGGNIPDYALWEATIHADGIFLKYIGERTPGETLRREVVADALPFLNGR